MRPSRAVSMLILVAVLVAGCDGSPTPTPIPTLPAPATPPAVVTQPRPSVTATPTPLPARTSIDLGVPAGDTYNVLAGVLDPERGLLYALGSDGDARDEGGVLTAVDLAAGQVQASVPVPVIPDWPLAIALSADGSRLYVTGRSQEQEETAFVISTGAGSRPLGEVLGTVGEARTLALDAAGGILYVANQRALRMLDALTLKEREVASLRADISPTLLLAVNPQAGRVYVSGSGDNIINTFRADDLSPVAAIEPGAQVYGLSANAGDPHTYAITQAFTRPEVVSRVAVMEGDRVARQWDSGPDFYIGRVSWDGSGNVLLLEDGRQAGVHEARIRFMNPQGDKAVRTILLPFYANLQYAAAVSVYEGALYRLGDVLYPIGLDGGETGRPVALGISLIATALDETDGRLFVLDSAGDIHVVAVPAMERLQTWHALEQGLDRLYRGQMLIHDGRLYVADFQRDVTLVLDAASGSKMAEIAKAGQVAADPGRNRLFIANQGIYVADGATYEIIGSIADTVRQEETMYSPGATEVVYDAASDLLFVTMTNNGSGSGSRTWLEVYDGKTLGLAESHIESDQRFVSGLAVDAESQQVWLASNYPKATLSVWALDGRLLKRLQGLAGRLYLDPERNRLYVRSWGGLVAVDVEMGDAAGFRAVDVQFPDITVLDTRNRRFYLTSSNRATVRSVDADMTPVSSEGVLGPLPTQPVRQIAIGEDGAMIAVSVASDLGNTGLFRRTETGWVRVAGTVPDESPLRIVAAAGTPGVFFAFPTDSYSPAGLFRSTDGGRTWSVAARGVTDFYIRDAAFSPGFAADGTGLLLAGGTGFFQTADGGDTWKEVPGVVGIRAAASAGPSFMVLALDSQFTSALVYVSKGAGGALEQVGAIPMFPGSVKALALSPSFAEDGVALVATENGGMFLSADGGRKWEPVGPAFAPLLMGFSLLFAPDFHTSRTVYALANELYYGGREERTMLRSTDGGRNWHRAMNLPAEITCAAMAADGQVWMGTLDGRVETLNVARLAWESAPAPTPTFTPPAPTPAPTPTPMVFLQPPQGLYWPDGIFMELWRSDENLRQALGWAADPQAHDTAAAFQTFEGGVMIWRQDASEVYILFPPGEWFAITDTWVEGQPESDPSIIPPQGRFQPVRGFGRVWRNEQWLRQRVGWAVEQERGSTAQAQRFEHGWMLRLEGGIYGLVNADIGPAFWQRREGEW